MSLCTRNAVWFPSRLIAFHPPGLKFFFFSGYRFHAHKCWGEILWKTQKTHEQVEHDWSICSRIWNIVFYLQRGPMFLPWLWSNYFKICLFCKWQHHRTKSVSKRCKISVSNLKSILKQNTNKITLVPLLLPHNIWWSHVA